MTTPYDTCPVCGKRPIPGYVPRHGIYLETHCLKCHQANPDSRENYKRNPSTIGHRGGARS